MSQLNNLQTYLKASLLLSLTLVLNGCFETGQNQGSNQLNINGSILKGRVNQGEVEIYDAEGRMLWQGKSDDQGQYQAQISSAENTIFTVVVSVANQSTMRCDSIMCEAPLTGTTYEFGETMPGSELGDIQLKNVIYVEHASDNTQNRQSNIQINALTTFVVDMIEEKINNQLDRQGYQNIVNAGNKVVINSLGISLQNSQSLATLRLPDINQLTSLEGLSDDTVDLTMINAALSNQLTTMDEFSNALKTLKSGFANSSARNDLSQARSRIIHSVNDLFEQQFNYADLQPLAEPPDYAEDLEASFDELNTINE